MYSFFFIFAKIWVMNIKVEMIIKQSHSFYTYTKTVNKLK
jgi:hypothetical protein